MKIGISSGNITVSELSSLELGDGVDSTPNIIEESSGQFARDLIGAGMTVVYGHDWRPSGVMQHVAEFVTQERSKHERPEPAIINIVPNKPGTSVALPAELSASLIDIQPQDNDCMFNLRTKLAAECDTCICIGGKLRDFQGSIPGIFEEAWRMANASIEDSTKQPPIICRCLAGAAGWLAASLAGEQPADDIQYTPQAAGLKSGELPTTKEALLEDIKKSFESLSPAMLDLHQQLWIEKSLSTSRDLVNKILI
jgi:hypothetical protein